MGKGKSRPHPTQPHPAPNPGRETPEPKPCGFDISPLTGKIDALVDAYKTAHKDDQKNTGKQLTWNRVTAISTLAAFIAAGVAAVFGFETIGQIKRQANYAQSQVVATEKQMRQDQRPWIKGEVAPTEADGNHFKITTSVGSILEIPIRITNIGKTPASDVSGAFDIQIAGMDDGLYLPDDMTTPPIPVRQSISPTGQRIPPILGLTTITSGIIFSGQYHDWVIRLVDYQKSGIAKPTPVTPEEYNRIHSGQAIVYVIGTINYSDVFEIKHWLRYCNPFPENNTRPQPETTVSFQRSCSAYNRADSNY